VIAVFYTGDIRHNQLVARKNHQQFLDALAEIDHYQVYDFTRNDPERGQCPYDPPPEQADPDNVYRRGFGGGVQVWDFMRGVQRTTEPVVIRLRTDLWFTASSIQVICDEIKLLINNHADVAYFGSDWLNDSVGQINMKLPVNIHIDPHVQDFVVAARRDGIKDFDTVINDINVLNPNKRRSGNKLFRYILKMNGLDQVSRAHRILCQLWLIRQDYGDYPTDSTVVRDYIQSYIVDDKAKAGKKNMLIPHPMQDAVNWWRQCQGWEPKEIENQRWWDWQKP
jgi:hypothetical protein